MSILHDDTASTSNEETTLQDNAQNDLCFLHNLDPHSWLKETTNSV